MSRGAKKISFVVVAAVLAVCGASAHAAKFKTLQSFGDPQDTDGSIPVAGAALVMDSAGNLYGTTTEGGAHLAGTAFVLKPKSGGNYTFRAIANFFSRPTSGLTIDTQGNLYGKASTFFRLSYGFGNHHNRWQLFDLDVNCSRNCGTTTLGNLTYAGQASGAPWDGVSPLYGATADGGKNGVGTAFSLTPNGTTWIETVLYSFCSQGGDKCTDGSLPASGLVLDQAGKLYGVTHNGGGHDLGNNGGGAGTVYQLSLAANLWTETVLHAFCSSNQCTDGAFPSGTLTLDGAGNILGATEVGGGKCSLNGKLGCGVIFELAPNGGASQETVLYAFCAKRNCADGAQPHAAPILDSVGNLFGTTQNGGGNNIDRFGMGGGVAYELAGSSYKVFHRFCSLTNCADGEYPQTSLTLDQSGAVIGTTTFGGSGGTLDTGGTVFRARP